GRSDRAPAVAGRAGPPGGRRRRRGARPPPGGVAGPAPMTPRATVRLQLSRAFGFDAARACIDYYAALGISHYYLSPVFRACAGSTHGYDAIDFQHVSDELGGRAGLQRLAEALRARGMGIVLDIVPNHMGVASPDNAWWN